MDDERTEEGEKLVPKCVISHNGEKESSGTIKSGEEEGKPLLTEEPSKVVHGTEKDVKHGNVFMSTVAQAQQQKQQQKQQQQRQHQIQKQQSSGVLKIAVFIKKPVKKDRNSSEGNRDPGNIYELNLEKGKSTTACEIKEKMLANLHIPKESAHLFALWFISPYLELQIKPHHKPFQLRKKWSGLLEKLSDCSPHEASLDEPVVVFQRNSFISIAEENKQADPLVLKRLFEEASFNVLNARYRMSVVDAERLGGILLRLHEGEFNPNLHQPGFFKSKGLKLSEFLPYYAIGSNKVSQYIYSTGTEHRLLQQYQALGETLADNLSCYKMFLKHCHDLTYYGSAFFKGSCFQEGVNYKMWKSEKRLVTIAINCYGITIFRGDTEEVLSHLSYGTFSWDEKADDSGASTSDKVFIIEYADSDEQERRIQIYSKQASLMDALVNSFSQSFGMLADEDKTIGEEMSKSNDVRKLNSISYIAATTAESA